MMYRMKNWGVNRGSIMLLVLVFGAVFFTILMALSGFVLVQNRAGNVTRAETKSLAIAEAGLEYYRWFLFHFPGSTDNGTGHAGPYVVSYADPEGGTVGTYSLSIGGSMACG